MNRYRGGGPGQGSGAAPGVGDNVQSFGASFTASTNAGGTADVQLTGVVALVLLALVVVAARNWL